MFQYYTEKTAHCVRCGEPCEIIMDNLEDMRGRVLFAESKCCGAPVTWKEEKKDDDSKPTRQN